MLLSGFFSGVKSDEGRRILTSPLLLLLLLVLLLLLLLLLLLEDIGDVGKLLASDVGVATPTTFRRLFEEVEEEKEEEEKEEEEEE